MRQWSCMPRLVAAIVLLLLAETTGWALDCPRSLGCAGTGCTCGDTVVSNFTMNADIVCPQTFNDPTFGLKVNPGVTLDGKDASSGVIHKIVGPGNPDNTHPNTTADNVGIWLLPNTVSGVTQPITVQNVDVSGFRRGVEIQIGSNGNTLLNIATHDNGNFLATNAHGYGIDVLGSDNAIDGCQIAHNADEGIHFSSSEPEGSTAPHGTCSTAATACTRDADCPAGETCVVVNGARNTMKSTTAGAGVVSDNGRENIYVRITSATRVVDTLSSYPGRCSCTAAADCGTGGVCGTTGPWTSRCIKGTPTACTTSADCTTGHSCLHGSAADARTAYIKHSVDGVYRRNTFADATLQLIGNSRDNFFGRPSVSAGGNTFTNANIKFSEHPDDGGFPFGNHVRYGSITNPSGPCVIFHFSSVNTIDHVPLTCGGSFAIQSDGFCAIDSAKDCSANGNDCVAQCNSNHCENTGTMCTANSGCGCVNNHCDQDPSVSCTTHNDCRLCAAFLPNGPNEVCDTALPTFSPAAPAPTSLVLNGATCP